MRAPSLAALLAISTLTIAGCSRPEQPASSSPSAASAPAPAPAAESAPAPAPSGHDLVLRNPADCKSEATPISISVKRAAFPELLNLFSEISQKPIKCPTCPVGVTASGDLADVPWDCVLADLAAQMSYTVEVGTEEIVLHRSGE